MRNLNPWMDFEIGSLPPVVFFDPLPCFAGYVASLAPHRHVIDVGAGAGRMSRFLASNGFKVLAVDIYERDNSEFDVAPLDATIMDYPENCLPIMARPCHGQWVDDAIDRAMQSVPLMIYVGLRRNFGKDLSEVRRRYTLTFERQIVGMDGETVVKIERKNNG